jgi:DNA polymerase-3 subunit alpha
LADLKPQEQPKLLAGVVTGVRVRMTQRGKMAIVTLDDAVARVEVVVGSEMLNQNAHLIKEDQLLIIEGRVSNDDFSGGIRVTARKLFDIASARSNYASMLKISCNGQSDAAKLSTILRPYCKKAAEADKKRCPVKIEYHNAQGQASLMLGDDWRVELQDELLQNLHTWLSADNVKILYN